MKSHSKTIEAANILAVSDDYQLMPDNGNPTPGIIVAANESRFIEANFSEPLTTYAVGYKDPADLDALLEFLAPMVPTSRRFQFAKANNAEEFLTEGTEDIRGIGADFKRVEYTSQKADSSTQNKGLTLRVDLDQVEGMANWQQIYTGKLMRRLLRAEIRRAYALLYAAASNNAKTWSSGTPDPDQDMFDAAIAYGDVVGMQPTRLLMGITAWALRRKAFRAQNTAGGFASAGMKIQEVAEYIGCREGYVSTERYTTGEATKGKFVGAIALLFMAEAGQTPEDPSNIKRFVSNTEGGSRFRVYAQQINAKLFDITVEHYSRTIVTSTLGIQKVTPS